MKYGDLTLGQVEAIANKLGGMEGIQRFLSGLVTVKTIKYVIDCNADPFVPDGWRVESHNKGGQLEFDLSKIRLHLDEGQTDGRVINGNELRKKLEGQPTLNANVLDYLLKFPELIPEEWKGKLVFFWGTIYRHSAGSLVVRCLSWCGDGWDWRCDWLDDGFGGDGPSALLAS